MKSTNYINTFISVADDCPVQKAVIPPLRGSTKTTARIQYEMIAEHPYSYTSDDVIFEPFAIKNEISDKDKASEKEIFFSKGRACMRASALTKRYGWGVHSNQEGKIAIYAIESDSYARLADDRNLKHVKAMRSKRG